MIKLKQFCSKLFTFQLWEDKEGKKKMNKNNAKALSTLRQKIRKYNRDYESEIAAYKEVNVSHRGPVL